MDRPPDIHSADDGRIQDVLAVLETATFGSFPRPWACDVPPRYEPLRILGSGAMGTVLLVRDGRLGRLVALKILRETSKTFLERFEREARLMSRLSHPSIVPLYEFGEVGKRAYLTMAYVDGSDLTSARLGPRELIQTMRGVVDALAFAHENGIVHRDVKPGNVVLDTRGRAYLTDFGLAFEPGEDSERDRTPAVAGTPLVMAPEQTRGEHASPASDVFSLGVTLFHALTGTWPFQGRTVDELLSAIEHGEPPRLRSLEPAIPRALEEIVLRCLEKEPAHRFRSMSELGHELDRLLRRRLAFGAARLFAGRRRGIPGGSLNRPEEPP